MKTKAILLMVFFLGWITTGWATDHVKGNGKLASRRTPVADYNGTKVDGVAGFNYEQSDDPSTMEATVGQNLHPYVNIKVKDHILTVAFKEAKVDHFMKFIIKTNSKWLATARASGNANFMINSPLTGDETVIKTSTNSLMQLKKAVTIGKLDLNISGDANVVINYLETDRIECDIDGSGSITIKKGNTKEGDYSIVSSGNIYTFRLAVPQLSCKVAGNGLAEVHTIDNLKTNIAGKGDIRYKGPTAIQ